MPMNFPTPTFIGQQWSNGTTIYQWDGVTWNIVPQMMPVYISDTPPLNPAVGQEWWRSTNGQLYVWYDDGNSKQWVQSAGAATPTSSAWEKIFGGTVTSTTQWQQKDLAAFEQLRLGVDLAPDSAAGSFTLHLSEDNGATWVQSANYTTQVNAAYLSTPAYGQQANITGLDMAMGNLIQPTSGSIGLGIEYIFRKFNKPGWTRWSGWGGMYTSTGPNTYAMTQYGTCTRTNPCNAIRILGSQAYSGRITLEGIRG